MSAYIPNWAMLAENYLEQDYLPFPLLAQPKLNGVRAKWCHVTKRFISRQCKVWPEHVLPHLYEKLNNLSPNVSLDGELYCHGLPFQTITGMVGVRRVLAHPEIKNIEYKVYDVIAAYSAYNRLLAQPVNVIHTMLCSRDEVEEYLKNCVNVGYEGCMLRYMHSPYIVGRTQCLLKYKPYQYAVVTIKDFIEGRPGVKGLLTDSLGALVVTMNGKVFKVGGGSITHEKRKRIWEHKYLFINQQIHIRFTELSKAGIPLQPQIV